MGFECSAPALLESLKIMSSQENSAHRNYVEMKITKLVAKDTENAGFSGL